MAICHDIECRPQRSTSIARRWPASDLTRQKMITLFKSEFDNTISRLRSAASTGSLKAVVSELTTICKEIMAEGCSKLARMMPGLSVETARVSVRNDD